MKKRVYIVYTGGTIGMKQVNGRCKFIFGSLARSEAVNSGASGRPDACTANPSGVTIAIPTDAFSCVA